MPGDLARNSLRLFSRANLAPLILGAGAAAASHRADLSVREHFEQPRLGRAGDIFGARLGSGAVVAAGVGSVWLVSHVRGSEHFSQFSYDLAQASTLNGLITLGLKQSIRRERPSGGHYSFPSGHTSTAFAIAAVVDHHYGWKTSVTAYATATFIGFSRIDSSKHYLSDVVAGATVGYIAGRTVTRRPGESGVLWTPFVSPSSRTAGVTVSW